MLTEQELNKQLAKTCQNANFTQVKESLKLQPNGVKADIHDDDEYALRWACKAGSLEIVQYLLESTEITEHATLFQLNVKNDLANYAFVWACKSTNLELIRYLIKRPDFKLISHEFLLKAFMVAKNDISCSYFPHTYEEYVAGYHSEEVNKIAKVLAVLLTECEHFPNSISAQEFSYLCDLNNPDLIELFFNQTKIQIEDFSQTVKHAAWTTLHKKAYASLNYLTERFSQIPLLSWENYCSLCIFPHADKFRYLLTHEKLRQHFDISQNTYWHHLFENPLRAHADKNTTETFEFLCSSKLIDKHIDLEKNNFEGVRYLMLKNEIRILRMLKRKKLFKPDEAMYQWIQNYCSEEVIEIFKQDYTKQVYKKLKATLPKKKATPVKRKI